MSSSLAPCPSGRASGRTQTFFFRCVTGQYVKRLDQARVTDVFIAGAPHRSVTRRCVRGAVCGVCMPNGAVPDLALQRVRVAQVTERRRRRGQGAGEAFDVVLHRRYVRPLMTVLPEPRRRRGDDRRQRTEVARSRGGARSVGAAAVSTEFASAFGPPYFPRLFRSIASFALIVATSASTVTAFVAASAYLPRPLRTVDTSSCSVVILATAVLAPYRRSQRARGPCDIVVVTGRGSLQRADVLLDGGGCNGIGVRPQGVAYGVDATLQRRDINFHGVHRSPRRRTRCAPRAAVAVVAYRPSRDRTVDISPCSATMSVSTALAAVGAFAYLPRRLFTPDRSVCRCHQDRVSRAALGWLHRFPR